MYMYMYIYIYKDVHIGLTLGLYSRSSGTPGQRGGYR